MNDKHAQTAVKLFGVKYEEVTPEMRLAAKSVDFGRLYSMDPFRQEIDIEKLTALKATFYGDSNVCKD